jgi:hypothetical protein
MECPSKVTALDHMASFPLAEEQWGGGPCPRPDCISWGLGSSFWGSEMSPRGCSGGLLGSLNPGDGRAVWDTSFCLGHRSSVAPLQTFPPKLRDLTTMSPGHLGSGTSVPGTVLGAFWASYSPTNPPVPCGTQAWRGSSQPPREPLGPFSLEPQ